jgi:hypothetical protein
MYHVNRLQKAAWQADANQADEDGRPCFSFALPKQLLVKPAYTIFRTLALPRKEAAAERV